MVAPATALVDYDSYDNGNYDYANYDYADDYSYDYSLLSRIVKAVKNKQGAKSATERARPPGILTGSVRRDFEYPPDLLNSLPPPETFDLFDFESQVETVDTRSIS